VGPPRGSEAWSHGTRRCSRREATRRSSTGDAKRACVSYFPPVLDKAVEPYLVRMDKVHADTTVVEANIEHPTDSGLLTKVVGKIGSLVERAQATGSAARTTVVDRTEPTWWPKSSADVQRSPTCCCL